VNHDKAARSAKGPKTVYLMYHELEVPGRPLCSTDPGYVRYIVHESNFRDQMRALKFAGLQGRSVSEVLAKPDGSAVAITFDDGSETDLLVAAPILRDYAFTATSYVTSGFVGTAGYLSPAQLRDLGRHAIEIGCHSMTHAYLDDLGDEDLHREIVEAKDRLEQIAGESVRHFSCPGGRWTARVAKVAREAGYSSVATSRISVNEAESDPFCLSRVAVMRGTNRDTFENIIHGRQLWRLQLPDLARAAVKRIAGNSAYDRLRALLLRRSLRS
jgi:peptidoglycan/xylan/chitin deacetylase (PgdA/CDA1 family)